MPPRVEGSRLSGEVFFAGTTPPLRSARARGGVVERCIAGAGCATAGGEALRGDPSSSSSSSPSYRRDLQGCERLQSTRQIVGRHRLRGWRRPRPRRTRRGLSGRRGRDPPTHFVSFGDRGSRRACARVSFLVNTPARRDPTALGGGSKKPHGRKLTVPLDTRPLCPDLTWVWPHLREETRRAECGPRVPRTETCPPSRSYPVRKGFTTTFYDPSQHLPTLETSDIVSRQLCTSFRFTQRIFVHITTGIQS